MKRYSITVNGTTYDVVVEEADAQGYVAPVAQAPVAAPAAPAPVAAPAPKAASPKPAASGATGATQVTSPMPGTILDVKVSCVKPEVVPRNLRPLSVRTGGFIWRRTI